MTARAISSVTWVLLSAVALFAQNGKRGIEIARPDTVAERAGRRYALLIGVDAYTSLPPLKTALADAQAVAAMLQSMYGFESEVLPNARRDDILSALNRFRKKLMPEDSVLIYYAGHGYFDRVVGKGYWLPADAAPDDTTRWIISDDITSSVKALPARHVLIVSDSCYSGTLSRAGPVSLRSGSEGDRSLYLANMSKKTSRILLASGGNEPVSDGDGDGKHSIFASVFLQGLEQRPPGKFTVEELFHQNVRERVAGRSGQVPECNPLLASGHDSGTFIFERSATPAVPAAGASNPFSRALELFDSMDEGAIGELEKVMRAQPGNLDAAAFHALAVCADAGLGPPSPLKNSGLKEAQNVLAKQPGNAAALVALPYCASGTPSFQSARNSWNNAARTSPSDARGFLLRGLALRGLSDWPRAIEDFTSALRLKTDFVHSIVLRGLTYFNLRQNETAISDFTQALRLKPVFPAFVGRAYAYRNLRQYDRALPDFNEALRLRTDSAHALFGRGMTFFDLSNYEKAIIDLTASLQLNPGSVRALVNRANAYRMTKDFDRAVADYTAAIALDARDTEARDYRGQTLSLQGKLDDAVADWTESLRINPKNGLALRLRASAFMQASQYDRAIADYTELVRLEPRSGMALNARARAKEAAGDAAGAQADRDAAKRLTAK